MKRREFLSASLLALAATRVHAARGWKVVREYRHPGDINVEQVELSRDGQFLASWATDGSLALWNVRNNNQLLTRAERCQLVGFEPKALVFNEGDATRRYYFANAEVATVNAAVQPSVLSGNREWWAGLRGRSSPTVWNVVNSKVIPLNAPQFMYRPEPRLHAFSPDGKFYVLAQGVRAVLWEVAKPDDYMVLPDQPAEITNLALTKDARWVLMGCMGGRLVLHNRMQPNLSQVCNYGGDVRGLSLDARANQALVGCSDGGIPVALQLLPSPRQTTTMPANPQRWSPADEAWSCWLAGDWAVTGHRGGLVRLWKNS